MLTRPTRRAMLVGIATTLVACKREDASRCKQCGMKIDPESVWRTELVAADGSRALFDSPRCAFLSWRSGASSATTLRAQDYYGRKMRDGRDLRYVVGGDIVGPMGPDLVPVEPPLVLKFIQDHGADRALTLDEVTLAVLSDLTKK